MAKTPEQYAEWLVTHQDKQGTPEWETVAEAYRQSRGHTQPRQETPAPSSPDGRQESVSQGTPARFNPWSPARYNPWSQEGIDRALGDWSGRFILGSPLATIPMAVTQLVGGERGRELVAAIEASKQRGMKYHGKEGFDWYGLLGGVMGGAPVAKAIASKLPQATNWATRALQNVLIGGAGAATQPVHHGATGEPVAESDFWGRKADQTFTGGVLGGAISLGTDATKFGWDVGKSILSPLWQKGRERLLAKYQDKLTGSPGNKAKIIAALDRFYKNNTVNAETAPTVGQILGDIPEATGLAADQARVAHAPGVSPAFAVRHAAQEKARLASIQQIGKTPSQLEEAIKARSEEAKILYGAADPLSVKGDSTLKELLKRPSMSKVMRRASDLAREDGKLFKIGQDIPAHIETSAILGPTGGPIQRTIPAQSAKYPVNSLHYMKMAMDDLIKNPERFGIGAAEARAIAGTRDTFVKWVESKATLYKVAREAYKTASGPINRMQIGQQLEKELTNSLGTAERGAAFGRAVQNQPRTLLRATGQPRYDKLSDVLTPKEMQNVNAVTNSLAQNDKYKNLAGQTTGAHGVDLEKERNLLDRRMMFASWLMEHFGRVPARDQLNQMAAGQYLDGTKMLEALRAQPTPPWVEEVADAIAKQLPMASGVAVGRQY